MFQTVQEAIDWVCVRTRSTHRYSTYKDYVKELGNPQFKLKTIHVAGTNGKGSTTNYIRSILQAAGYKVGSFTSPHLTSHLDRIRINDEDIDAQYFLDKVNANKEIWEAHDMTMFEIDMLISIDYFLDNQVDYAVYEVGMGGRRDPTNIIDPIGAVITNIEMDHMKSLGDTIGKIAFEKAGIIKDELTVVTFERKREALEQFELACENHHAHLIQTADAANVAVSDHIEFDYLGRHFSLPTNASYQVLNATAAISLIDYLNLSGQVQVSANQLKEGLQTRWRGRFEQVSADPRIIIDGAHNENGIDALCHCIDDLHEEVTIVFSALADKQYHKMLGMLMEKGEVIVTHFDNKRATTADQLAMGYDVTVVDDYRQAIQLAIARGRTVIITGSLYFISIVREMYTNQQ